MNSPHIYGMKFTVIVPQVTFSIEAANKAAAEERARACWYALHYHDHPDFHVTAEKEP